MANIIGFENPVFRFRADKNGEVLEIDAQIGPNEQDLKRLREFVWSNAETNCTGEFVDAAYLRLAMQRLRDLALGEVSDETSAYMQALSDAGIAVMLTGGKFVLA